MVHSVVYNVRELDAIPILWQSGTYTFHLLSSGGEDVGISILRLRHLLDIRFESVRTRVEHVSFGILGISIDESK